MKRILLYIIASVLLVGCAPNFNDPEEVVDETLPTEQQETAIIPSYEVSDSEYQVLLPYRLSQSRGVTTNQVANRLDIRTLENDLRRHAVDVFDPDSHFFQEGQQIGQSELYSWLERESEAAPFGLNPAVDYAADAATDVKLEQERENPKYLSHILEQNFLKRTDDQSVQLAGIALGIAMKSNYSFQTEVGGPTYYEDIPESTMMTEANRIADTVVERLRQKDGLTDVPIMLAIYREAPRSGLVPGNFVAQTTVSGGSSSVGDWETINDNYVLFPSTEARNLDPDLSATIEDFKQDIAEFFPNYVGLIGEGFFIGDQIQSLTLEIPIEFQGQAEVVGFTQYVYGLVMESFQSYFDIEVIIKSSNKQESLITRKRGEDEPFVHVYER